MRRKKCILLEKNDKNDIVKEIMEARKEWDIHAYRAQRKGKKKKDSQPQSWYLPKILFINERYRFFLIKEKFDRIYLQQDFSKEIIKIFLGWKKWYQMET